VSDVNVLVQHDVQIHQTANQKIQFQMMKIRSCIIFNYMIFFFKLQENILFLKSRAVYYSKILKSLPQTLWKRSILTSALKGQSFFPTN